MTDSPDAAPPTPTDSGEGIVGALMMVMQKRSKVIHSSGKYENINSTLRDGRVKPKEPKRVSYLYICPLFQMKVKMRVEMKMRMTMNGMTDVEVLCIFNLVQL